MNPPGTPPAYMSDSEKATKEGDLEATSYPGGPSPKKPSLYDRLCNNKTFQSVCRIMQMLSCTISLILFAIRLHRLAGHVVDLITASNGAVMGILAAAVVYSIAGIIIRMALKNGGPLYLRFVWVAFDIAFIVAFIMVAELTAPGRDMTSGPCHTSTNFVTIQGTIVDIYNALNCRLPLGTFILAIFSTILHTVTAVFSGAKEAFDYYKNKRMARMARTMP